MVAFDPELSNTQMIRQIVGDVPGAQLRTVRTKEALLTALDERTPDLVLLPPLMSPADEAQILQHLRTLADSDHLEVLVTPYRLGLTDRHPASKAPAWRRWFSRQTAAAANGSGDAQAFANQLSWSLRRAARTREEMAEHRRYARELAEPGSDRRLHLRLGIDQLPWLQIARIKDGPQVTLVDFSSGGILLESDSALPPESEAILELIGESEERLFPFRVVRSRQTSLRAGSMYRNGCVFAKPFDINDFLRPSETGPRRLQALNPIDAGVDFAYVSPDDPSSVSVVRPAVQRHERDARRTRAEVPWVTNVRLPWGLDVDLLNISKTGILVETGAKLTPGSDTEFSISGQDTSLVVPARVVRTEIKDVNGSGVRYQAAASFKNEVQLRFDRGEDRHELRARFCEQLRQLVSAREIAIRSAPTKPERGAEAIYFAVPSRSGSQAVLQATFDAGHHLEAFEFKLLKAAPALAAAILESEHASQ